MSSMLGVGLDVEQTSTGIGQMQAPRRVIGSSARALGVKRSCPHRIAFVQPPSEPSDEIVGGGGFFGQPHYLCFVGGTSNLTQEGYRSGSCRLEWGEYVEGTLNLHIQER